MRFKIADDPLLFEDGMAEIEFTGRHHPPPLTLLALGDCNTAGGGERSSIVHYSARSLEAAGYVCKDVNWGRTMTTTREGLARVRIGSPYADVVLLNYGLVDSWVTTIPAFYIPYFPETPVKKVARKVLKSVKRRLRSPQLRRWVPRGEVVSLDEYDANLRRIIARLREANPSVTVLLWATANVRNNSQRNGNINRYNDQLRVIANDERCLFFETEPVLAAVPAERQFVDGVHFSDESSRRLGDAMGDALLPRLNELDAAQSDRTAA